MVSSCSAVDCTARDIPENKAKGITFHRFPKDNILREAWARATKRQGTKLGSQWNPSNCAVLCSQHFLPSDIEVMQCTKRLKENTVPSVFKFDLPATPKPAKQRRIIKKVVENVLDVSETSGDPGISLQNTNNDHSYCESLDQIAHLKQKLDTATSKCEIVKSKLRLTRKQVKHRDMTIAALLQNLKDHKLLEENDNEMLKHCFSEFQTELVTKKSGHFSEELKKFACTLHLYSPKAYEFARKTLNLPCRRTLRRWMENINGEPGMTIQLFDVIEQKIKEGDKAFKFCTLMLDSMAIKKKVEWDSSKNQMVGLVDLGNGSLGDEISPVATEVLVVMAVGILGHWKAPLAYYLVNGITASIQANLIKEIVCKLDEIGAVIVGLTCDGCYSNQQTLIILGAKLNAMQPQNLISISNGDKVIKIPVILDACHMLKLVRNFFHQYKILKSPAGFIEWKYVARLQVLQEHEMLSIANRITKDHINFQNNKMKVKLAAQVLSNSTACALKFCCSVGYTQFIQAEATIEFIEVFNQLFDILNSRTFTARGYKQPISSRNWPFVEGFLIRARSYLLSLTDATGKPLHVSRRKTAIIGFLLNIDSVFWLYHNHVSSTESPLKYLLTYKWSQDHLELFFGSVRQAGRFNNNPTAAAFRSIYKKMMYRCGVAASKNSSVTQQDETVMLNIGMARLSQDDCAEPGILALSEIELIENEHSYTFPESSALVDNVTTYIAGFVARRMLTEGDCQYCFAAVVGKKGSEEPNFKLLMIKDNGGLIYPSHDLVKVVNVAERVVRHFCHVKDMTKKIDNWGLKLELEVFKIVVETKPNIFSDVEKHCDLYNFLRKIIRLYLDIRRHYAAKRFTDSLHTQKLRQKLTKSILSKNE